jgi:cell division protein FtsN
MGRQWLTAAAAIACAFGAAGASADVQAGIEMWRAGDYAAAIREWRPLAEAGDADAQFNLGQAYKLGRGVPVDLRQAQTWYERAARQGHGQAEANLGLSLFQTGQQQQALPWLQRASERGDPRAQYVLATAHFNGDLVQRDWPRAYALMRRAADQGLPQATSSIAEMERHLSEQDRERGMVLARQMAAGAPVVAQSEVPRDRVPATPPARVPRVAQAQPPVVRTPVPPSAPARRPVQPAPRAEAPQPRVPAPAPAASGRWRVQLGAFGQAANAERQWQAVRGVAGMSGLQRHLVRAGAVTRLQAGPLASRAAADRVCAAARSAGHACIVVAP